MNSEIYPIITIGAGSLSAMAKPTVVSTADSTGGSFSDSSANPRMSTGGVSGIDAVIKGIGTSGISRIVSLLTDADARKAGLAEEGAIANRCGIEFIRFPISDFGVPAALPDYCQFIRQQYVDIVDGQHTVVHCYAGVGRTGMVTSSILLHCGYSPVEAFKLVSKRRGKKVPDTQAQIDWVSRHQSAILGN